MAERLWTMRILAGVHVGAEAALDDEEAVLGSGEECDFVLEDDGLAGRHVSLLPTGSGVRLTVFDAGNPVRIDGQPIDGSALLEPFQVVSIGELAFAVGPADQPWPQIDLPPVQSDGSDAGESNASAAESGPPDGEEAPDAGPGSAQAGDADGAPERTPGRRFGLAIAGAALLVVAGAIWLLTPKPPERQHDDPAHAVREIKEIASRHGAVVQVSAGEGPGAPISVTGNISTEQDLRALLDEMAQFHVRAAVHLVSSEQLVEYVNAILEQSLNRNGRNKVEALPVAHEPGKLVISGYVDREGSLAEARDLLARDLKGSRGLTYRIETRAHRLAALQRRLDGLELGGRMLIQQFDDGIGLFGPVRSHEELGRIRKLAEDFNAEFDSRPLLRLEGTDSFLGVSTIEFDVRAVVLGERIHVIAQDGSSYGERSRVPGGYVVKAITEHYMILERPVGLDESGAAGGSGIAYVIFDGA